MQAVVLRVFDRKPCNNAVARADANCVFVSVAVDYSCPFPCQRHTRRANSEATAVAALHHQLRALLHARHSSCQCARRLMREGYAAYVLQKARLRRPREPWVRQGVEYQVLKIVAAAADGGGWNSSSSSSSSSSSMMNKRSKQHNWF